jgi:superfamily II DNA or RNA helicase
LRTLVVVPTTAVFDQWVGRAKDLLGVDPGIIGNGQKLIGSELTIGMQKTLWGCVEKVSHEFGAVIFDECQLGAAKTYQDVIDRMPAIFRLGISGDERRADSLEFFIYDQFGTELEEVKREEAIAVGGAVPVDVVIVPTEFEANWYKSLTPERRFLKRGKLLEHLANDPARNELAAELARKCAAEGEQAIVLCSRREHCQILDAMVNLYGPSVQLVGANKQEFARSRAEFASGSARFAVGTYQAIGVGFESHRELARGVFASPVVAGEKSRMQFMQYLGRFARSAEGKRRSKVYYMLDERVFGVNHAKLIKKWCGIQHSSVLIGERRISVDEWIKGKKNNETTSGSDDEHIGDEGQSGSRFFDF